MRKTFILHSYCFVLHKGVTVKKILIFPAPVAINHFMMLDNTH